MKQLKAVRVRYLVILFLLVVAIAGGYYLSATSARPTTVFSDDISIKLERTPCFGACPIYQLIINGDGTVVYNGTRFVQVVGTAKTTIPREQVKELVAAFDRSNFFSLKDYTTANITDAPSAITSITVRGQTKTVRHYQGDRSAPQALTDLETQIDKTANSAQWVGK